MIGQPLTDIELRFRRWPGPEDDYRGQDEYYFCERLGLTVGTTKIGVILGGLDDGKQLVPMSDEVAVLWSDAAPPSWLAALP